MTVKSPHSRRPVGGGLRGRCGLFSRGSRRRLMRRMGQLQNETQALFVTLTYPAAWPGDWQLWKVHLDRFCKRLKRKFAGAGLMWKLEPQQRGAPHFHLIVFGVDWMPPAWLARAWYECVGSGDELHLLAGTQVQRVRSARGCRLYAAKYLGKVIDELPEGVNWEEVGRWWGIRFEDCIPWADCLTMTVDHVGAARMIRVLRRYLARVAHVRIRPGVRGLSAFVDASKVWGALPQLL